MSGRDKHYSPREEKLNAASHLVGLLLAAAAGIPLIISIKNMDDPVFTVGMIFYWISLAAMFGASSCYHLCKTPSVRSIIRKTDHCSIYLLITGTYAPLITGCVRNTEGYIVLGVLVFLSAAGIAGKIFFNNKFHTVEVIIYILMGWACVFLVEEITSNMSKHGQMLLLAGGITYTSGVIFYAVKREFFHAVWHIFVLLGAVLQFFAILTIGR